MCDKGAGEYVCKREEFCGNPDIKYRIDWDFYSSLHNWVEDLDLVCTAKSVIGLFGSMYFAGWAAGASFIPRLSDLYGRKLILFVSMAIHLFVYLAILLSRNMIFTLFLMVLFGCCGVGRASVGYMYLQELTPTKN